MATKSCECKEGYTRRTIRKGDRGRRIFEDKETPTGLHVHDCEYIAKRNKELGITKD